MTKINNQNRSNHRELYVAVPFHPFPSPPTAKRLKEDEHLNRDFLPPRHPLLVNGRERKRLNEKAKERECIAYQDNKNRDTKDSPTLPARLNQRPFLQLFCGLLSSVHVCLHLCGLRTLSALT